jgi:serine/threonine protein kinase/tetratricopeptide (TPR) repeat protein
MTCPSCGTANDDSDRFCRACRAPLPPPHSAGGPILGGRFRIIRSLGKGGMGEILLAEDVRLGRKVAIKSISDEILREGDSKARFQREARAASRLDHANICTIYEIAEEKGREYIVMQYVDGVTLDQLMKMKPLPLDKVVDIALQIADGLAAAQGCGIVHRDIKPGNIMIDRSGQVKILDFGLAKIGAEHGRGEAERSDRDLTEKGIVLGTVAYMSPEQAKGLVLDGRSDIFSFGVVLYEMIENRNPFSDDENIVTLYNILHREVRFGTRAPEALRRIVGKALQKDRERRYGSFGEIRRELAALKDEPPPRRRLAGRGTEIIDSREQATLLGGSGRPPSSGEDLSEMVSRLKRLKASTEAVKTGRSRRYWLAAVVLAPLAAGLLWLGLHRTGRDADAVGAAAPGPAAVLLYPFENQTPDKAVAAEIHYLLLEALGQSAGFRVLDESTLRDLNSGLEMVPAQLPRLLERHGVRFLLHGKLSCVADKFNIEARLVRVGEREGHAPFFIPGKERNSLLSDQIDNLARRVRRAVLGAPAADEAPPVRLAAMYGASWQAFDLFHRGLALWNKKQFGQSRQLLLGADRLAGGMPAARFHLALLADYTGNAAAAQKELHALLPGLREFSRPLQLKIRALKAKFDFDIQEQVRCLRELKAMFPFSKEMIFELGEAYFRHGDAGGAIPEFNAALALDRNYAAALNHLGYCYSYLGRHQQAIECFERYRDIDRTANSFDSLGDGYFYLGDYTQAENSKIYAVSLDDSMDWPYLTIADIHILRANFAEAGKALENYRRLATYPKARADALAKRAFIRYLEGEYDAALELLGQARREHDSAAIADHSGECHWLAGLCQIARGDLPAAEQEWHWLRGLCDSYRLSADNFDAALKYRLHLEARLAERLNRPQKARALYRELLAMKTQLSFWITYYNYQFFLTEYAEFLMRQKDAAAAGQALADCLAFNPGYPPALWDKAALLRSAGDGRYHDVLERIAAIYGAGGEDNRWRRRLASELR